MLLLLPAPKDRHGSSNIAANPLHSPVVLDRCPCQLPTLAGGDKAAPTPPSVQPARAARPVPAARPAHRQCCLQPCLLTRHLWEMGTHPVAQVCNSPCPAGAASDPDRPPASPPVPADAPSPCETPSVHGKPVNGKVCSQAQPTAAALEGVFAAPQLLWCKLPQGPCKRDLLSPLRSTNCPPAPLCCGSPVSSTLQGELCSPWAGPRRTQVLEVPWCNELGLMAGEMLRLEIADGSGWLEDEPCSESQSFHCSWPWATRACPARPCTRVYAELGRARAYMPSAAVCTGMC